MTITTELNTRLHAAAALIETQGWVQDAIRDATGAHCATGAVMHCRPRDGDENIIRAVQLHRDRGEDWNDTAGRTADEVVASLRDDITDVELAEVFGPQWAEIVALVRRVATLTETERRSLSSMWEPTELTAEVTNVTHRFPMAGFTAARTVAWLHDSQWAMSAVRDAANALSMRHLMGTHWFDRVDYRNLTAPWLAVIGRVHPDD